MKKLNKKQHNLYRRLSLLSELLLQTIEDLEREQKDKRFKISKEFEKYWEELELLIGKQNYKCALTGDNISFNDDIELDHIIPTTRNGKNELSNVRWVTRQSNRLKNNLTDDELREICLKIIQNT